MKQILIFLTLIFIFSIPIFSADNFVAGAVGMGNENKFGSYGYIDGKAGSFGICMGVGFKDLKKEVVGSLVMKCHIKPERLPDGQSLWIGGGGICYPNESHFRIAPTALVGYTAIIRKYIYTNFSIGAGFKIWEDKTKAFFIWNLSFGFCYSYLKEK